MMSPSQLHDECIKISNLGDYYSLGYISAMHCLIPPDTDGKQHTHEL